MPVRRGSIARFNRRESAEARFSILPRDAKKPKTNISRFGSGEHGDSAYDNYLRRKKEERSSLSKALRGYDIFGASA